METSPPYSRPGPDRRSRGALNGRPKDGLKDRSTKTPARVSIQFASLRELQDAFLKAQSDVWVEDCIADRSTGTLTFAALRTDMSSRPGSGRFWPEPKPRR